MRRPAALALLLGACSAPAGESPAADRPNVLLILTDDQGYGDVGVHGNDRIRTPNLDALAARGARFSRFYVSPVCSPTRASLYTGRYNYRTGVVDTYLGRSLMHADEVTVAEILGAAGYRTALFGKWHLGDNYPLRAMDQGFRETLVLKGGGIGQPSDPPGGDTYFDPTLYRNGAPVKTRGYVTDVLTEAALRFLRDPDPSPFFACVAYNAPHTPLQVPESYVRPYLAQGLPPDTARVYGMVANIDENVGRLLAALEASGRARRTLVLFLSDNGPQQDRYNAGLRGRKGSVFEGGLRVPCFALWPERIRPGTRVERPAAHIDLTPTILEACGVPRPEETVFDGESLLAALEGREREAPERTIFAQWHRGDVPEKGRSCAAITSRWKLVRTEPHARPLLFDLRSDPAERYDLAERHPEEVERLWRAYEAWFADVRATRGYAPPRIRLGSPRENPTLLTRQDWRGPRAGWGADSLGHWEVEIDRAGTYEIRLLFRAAKGPATARISVAGAGAELPLDAGATRCSFRLDLPAGPARLEPHLAADGRTWGVEYAEVRRAD
jgi:arylsulfatase A-like enzyme